MANIKNQEAPVEESRTQVESFVLKYKKVISIAVVAIVLVVAGIICINNFYLKPRQAEASTALAKGQDLFMNQDYEKALKGDGAGYIGFLKVIDQYGGTDASNLANLYAGLCYANLNKWQEAEKYLDNYSAGDDAMVSPAAEAALGHAYANLNQVDKAIDCLKKAAKMADSKMESGHNNSLAPQFLLSAGQLLESQNKKADALAIYKSIKENYVNSPIASQIDKYIERVSE